MRINIFAPLVVAGLLYASIAFGTEKSCETVGPRLDGSCVTICDGSVVKVSMERTVVAASDRCAQLDTVSAGEALDADTIGLPVCGTDSALDGTIYAGQVR